MLRDRILDPNGEEFNERTRNVLKEIFDSIQANDVDMLNPVPVDEEEQISLESIKMIDFDILLGMLIVKAADEPLYIFQFLESQGYDMWLTQAAK